ncbi:alpha/beta fold hydrolase [Streptomyces sp. NPDC050315]|uniref:thioesterase II family protein n=1 Tax=Streptomyces sp. NPDC050315 TaxID=3155039 RepID=UPI0034283003
MATPAHSAAPHGGGTGDPGRAWIRRFPPAAGNGTRLLCFPHAGGAAGTYFPFAKLLAPRIQVLGVQYPGRQDRRSEPPLADIAELADRVVDSLGPTPDDRPLALLGHSMGALVAFEVARRLEASGPVRPVRLFVSGRRAPSVPGTRPTLHDKDDAALLAELRRLSGTEDELLADEELVRLILPALRSDYRAVETYRPAPDARVACPVTVFTGDEDTHVTRDGALRWAGHTTGPCEVQTFQGGHFFINSQRRAVAEAVAARITTAAPE